MTEKGEGASYVPHLCGWAKSLCASMFDIRSCAAATDYCRYFQNVTALSSPPPSVSIDVFVEVLGGTPSSCLKLRDFVVVGCCILCVCVFLVARVSDRACLLKPQPRCFVSPTCPPLLMRTPFFCFVPLAVMYPHCGI